MSGKSIVMFGVVVGSTAGGYVPVLLGSDYFSYASIFGAAIGGLAGIWLGYKFVKRYL